MARTCAALRANILCLIEPVADATGSKYAGLRPEMDHPIKHRKGTISLQLYLKRVPLGVTHG